MPSFKDKNSKRDFAATQAKKRRPTEDLKKNNDKESSYGRERDKETVPNQTMHKDTMHKDTMHEEVMHKETEIKVVHVDSNLNDNEAGFRNQREEVLSSDGLNEKSLGLKNNKNSFDQVNAFDEEPDMSHEINAEANTNTHTNTHTDADSDSGFEMGRDAKPDTETDTETETDAETDNSFEETEKEEKIEIHFPGDQVLRKVIPSVFDLSEAVLTDWMQDKNFESLPIQNPFVRFAAKKGLRQAKTIEKKVLEHPVTEKVVTKLFEAGIKAQTIVDNIKSKTK